MQLPFNTRMIAREIQSCTNASKMPPTFDIKNISCATYLKIVLWKFD